MKIIRNKREDTMTKEVFEEFLSYNHYKTSLPNVSGRLCFSDENKKDSFVLNLDYFSYYTIHDGRPVFEFSAKYSDVYFKTLTTLVVERELPEFPR